VHRRRGRLVASPQATHIFNLHIFRLRARKPSYNLCAQITGAIQVAAHVRTDVNFRLRGRYQVKMGIKTGNAVKLVKRSLGAVRKGFQLRLWQITEAHLDGSQFVKDHGGSSHETTPRIPSRTTERFEGFNTHEY